jgi:FAD/FMN-containing dehydrogenase
MASEGSCQIGGNLSTNAGGIAVLRYGNAREQVMGLEVVLPDGQIWNGLRGLRKDNTGYDLKHLFIGAEGTLGIITAAVLKLYPRPKVRETALAAMASVENVSTCSRESATPAGDTLTGFEMMPRIRRGVQLPPPRPASPIPSIGPTVLCPHRGDQFATG